MPFATSEELPDGVRRVLPKHAQDIYKAAFNSAYAEYEAANDRSDNSNREEVSHRVAWSAVKRSYEKGDDDLWYPKK